jgi:hypothetical protein
MMKTLSRRLLNAGLIAAAVLAPTAAFAQDAAFSENASNFIGGLVVWLLPIGGAFAVGVMFASDKSAQQNRLRR